MVAMSYKHHRRRYSMVEGNGPENAPSLGIFRGINALNSEYLCFLLSTHVGGIGHS
jgi:hypothetical protein